MQVIGGEKGIFETRRQKNLVDLNRDDQVTKSITYISNLTSNIRFVFAKAFSFFWLKEDLILDICSYIQPNSLI